MGTQLLTPPPAGALLLLEDDERKRFDALAAQVREITESATLKPISNDRDYADLNELVSRGKKAAKAIEAARKACVDPLNKQVRALNDIWRPLNAALVDLEAKGKRLLLTWNQTKRAALQRQQEEAARQRQEAQDRELRARIEAQDAANEQARQEALAKADLAAQEAAIAEVSSPVIPKGIKTESGGTGVVERWVFEVVKPEEVPRHFLKVDEKAIRAAVAAGVREIPGVAIYTEESLAVRTREY